MTDAADPPPTRRRRRVARVMLGIGVALLLILWLARVPLATRFVDRELAAAGVPATYRVAGLGPRGQRLENVVIGDPRDPDLVADWIETQTGIGLSGPYLSGIRAGPVRLRARLVDGRVSLGSIDKLLPPPSGKPFALPALRVEGEDVRIRLETPAGVVGLKLAGSGRLDDGFRGTLAAVAPRLTVGGCTVGAMRAAVSLRIADAAPTVEGPVQAMRVACGEVAGKTVRADLRVALGPALDRWDGEARLAGGAVAGSGARIAGLDGTVSFSGSARSTAGDIDLTATELAGRGVTGAIARTRGRYRLTDAGLGVAGLRVAAQGVRVPADRAAPLERLAASTAGTPVAPLAAQLARASERALRGFALSATLDGAIGRRSQLAIAGLTLTADSGARIEASGAPIVYRWPAGGLLFGGRLALSGGGMPSLDANLAQARPGGPITGTATLRQPYAAGGASLALTPVGFTAAAGITRIDTIVTLSGPLGNGRVEALRLPIAVRWAGAPTLNSACTPIAAERLAVSGLVLDRPRLTLCPTDGALLRIADGRVAGGASIAAASLRGRLGSSPLAIDAEGARLDLAARGFAIEGLRTILGAPERATRFNFASFEGRLQDGALAGRYTGGGGRIGTVPLVLGEAAGDWRLQNGVLATEATLVVSDGASPARFQPMRGQSITLRLADNVITAQGKLVEPTTATSIADVTITHRLASGTGAADLRLPGLTFREGFQPELLTRVTFGVIADVRGTVTGEGRIAWEPDGVTSTGRFATDGVDLAAAFGPATGIAGTIAFDDLLSLRSAPNQELSVKTINPGIPVTDGVIRFRTLSSTQIQVDNGHWPFAGGTLTLDPTLLDFGQDVARRLTFRVERAAADRFLQQFEFGNLNATGTFDGVLPMVFDASGGRIVDGRLAVRQGGGTLAYVGDLTNKDLGFWGNLAFQSLRSLRYRDLTVIMNGPLSGEMVTEVRFAGVSQGEGARSNFLIRRLQRLPFVFNIRISAPFRGLLDSAQSFYDPRRLIQRNLPALLEEQRRRATPIQPSASETMP